jgi:F0F1-type ATP synthase membrane subunit c/vacuolar-type H+-ATPase subunit K
MNKADNDCQRISRRAALAGAAVALGSAAIAAAVSQAAAQQKISQADATYQGTPKVVSTATAVSIFNRRTRANSFRATSARTAGASCLPRKASHAGSVAADDRAAVS